MTSELHPIEQRWGTSKDHPSLRKLITGKPGNIVELADLVAGIPGSTITIQPRAYGVLHNIIAQTLRVLDLDYQRCGLIYTATLPQDGTVIHVSERTGIDDDDVTYFLQEKMALIEDYLRQRFISYETKPLEHWLVF